MEWLPGLLVSISMAVGSYEDVRVRAIHDWVWLPGAVGAVFLFLLRFEDLPFLSLRLAFLGALGYLLVRMGSLGEGDGIALVLVGVSPDWRTPLPQAVAAGFLLAVHLVYLWSKGWVGKRLLIPVEVFLREQRWIPKLLVTRDGPQTVVKDVNIARESVEELVKARGQTSDIQVEVQYGVPTAAYLGLGYIASYLISLLSL